MQSKKNDFYEEFLFKKFDMLLFQLYKQNCVLY